MLEMLKKFWEKHFGEGIPFESMYDIGDGEEPRGGLTPSDMINLPFCFVIGMYLAIYFTS